MQQTIVVIDDSLVVRRILEASLRRDGFTACSFSDGLQAMQTLAAGQVALPAAVILDIGLPKMDGYAIARNFKHHPTLRQAPIIMLSGHDRLIDKVRGRLAGASAYMTKPFQPALVLEVLRTLLATEEPSHQANTASPRINGSDKQ